MAEGWTHTLKADQIEIFSAGIRPKRIDPRAVLVMAEAGVNISHYTSKHVSEFKEVLFDYVVTVCADASEHCPILPGKSRIVHVGFDDPPKLAEQVDGEEEKLDCYRSVRDKIRAFAETLPESLTCRS